jgi:hypothetical protein
MNLIIKSIAIALALTLISLPVFGQMGDGKMGGDMMSGKAKEMMKEGMELRDKGGMIGMGFMHSEGRRPRLSNILIVSITSDLTLTHPSRDTPSQRVLSRSQTRHFFNEFIFAISN